MKIGKLYIVKGSSVKTAVAMLEDSRPDDERRMYFTGIATTNWALGVIRLKKPKR